MSTFSLDQSSETTESRSRAAPRTAHACLSCKKRRIKVRKSSQTAQPLPLTESPKCTGQPGPCQACSKNGDYCHFDSKLDARRRTGYKLSIFHHQQVILKS